MNTAHHDELLAEMGWVRGLARRLLLDASRADDAAQEALTRALSQPARSPRRGPALRAFLATATRVIARDQRRSDRRRVHRERTAARGEALVSTLETVERRAAVRSLVEAVEALDEPYRSAVRLRYLEQHSVAEVAAVTDAQPVTVRKRVSRGLAMLRGRLAEQHEAAHHEAGSGAWAVALLPFAGPLPELHHGRQLARLAALLVAGLGSWVALERVVGSELEAPPTPNRTLVAGAVELVPIELAAVLDPAETPRASATTSTPDREVSEPDDLALFAMAFSMMHTIGSTGEELCSRALEVKPADCASCHGGTSLEDERLPADGLATLRFAGGERRAQGSVMAGRKHGPWVEWHTDGSLASRGEYFDGERHGAWSFWQLGGATDSEGAYLYGRREGTWRSFDHEGALREESDWRGGDRHGTTRTWHPGGEVLASEEQWHGGVPHGITRAWDAAGRLATERRFERGSLTESHSWPPLDRNGTANWKVTPEQGG